MIEIYGQYWLKKEDIKGVPLLEILKCFEEQYLEE